jgi:Histidine phosphatase superfamily (branch 2)
MRRRSVLKVLAPCAMTFLVGRSVLSGFRGCTAQVCGSSLASVTRSHQRLFQFRGGTAASDDADDDREAKVYRTLQVQIVHRHGDRTPITPLKDEDFWASTLIPQEVLDKISSNTNVIINPGESNTHAAGGRGPFGKLTQMGLFQLVNLGTQLREELVSHKDPNDPSAFGLLDDTHRVFPYPWHPQRPLSPNNIKVVSTNFPRTIQSVQGLLAGLFPDGTHETIDIDARHTDILIPDPQPRRTPEQIALESHLAKQPHLVARDMELRPIAVRMTDALLETLGEGAFNVAFGVAEERMDHGYHQQPVLAWAQLAEITKCLEVRNKLPSAISQHDTEAIAAHTAWRWFEALRHPRLIYLAMNPMVSRMVQALHQHEHEPPVIIYSAHDSTLIGLLCGFRLEKPTVWPEYGSFLKVELMEVTCQGNKQHVVRFSLNGNLLRSVWEDEEPLHEIPLDILAHKIKTVGATA